MALDDDFLRKWKRLPREVIPFGVGGSGGGGDNQVADKDMDFAIWKAMTMNQFDAVWDAIGLENVNVHRAADGITVLMAASHHPQRLQELQLLLRLGADASLKNKSLATALDYARGAGNSKAVDILNPACRDKLCLHLEDRLIVDQTDVICTSCGLVLGSLNLATASENPSDAEYEDTLSVAMAEMALSQRAKNTRDILSLWDDVEKMRLKEARLKDFAGAAVQVPQQQQQRQRAALAAGESDSQDEVDEEEEEEERSRMEIVTELEQELEVELD